MVCVSVIDCALQRKISHAHDVPEAKSSNELAGYNRSTALSTCSGRIGTVIVTPNVSADRNPFRNSCFRNSRKKISDVFLNTSFFGPIYLFEKGGGGNARRPKKIYLPRVIFNIPGSPEIKFL